MTRSTGFLLALTLIFVSTAAAAAEQQRIRGTIQSFDQNSLTVASRLGDSTTITLGDATQYVYVVKSDLSAIDSGTFIGAASKQVQGMPVAIEVVVFPQSMAGMGEGHYPWDKLPDTTLGAAGTVPTKMTNATVKSAQAMDKQSAHATDQQSMVDTAMTNATVKQSNPKQRGARLLTVTYSGGKKMQILVPPSAPIVAFQPKDRAVLKQGAHVFVIAAGQQGAPAAKFVAVGKNGLNPPM